MENYKEVFIDTVKLVEKPNEDNGYFYVVEGNETGGHHIASIFGKVAQRGRVGNTYQLFRRQAESFSFYVLSD